jgi:acyl-CoA synthetase (AMP-forming)/AMP-acid ligase II
LLCEQADAAPDRLLYVELQSGVEETARLTAAELRDRAAALAGRLPAAGVRPGDVVLHIASSPAEFLVGLIGCMWAGVIAAPIAFPRRPEHLESRLEPVRRNAGAVALVAGTPLDQSERSVLELMSGGSLPVVPIVAADGTEAAARIREPEVAYLQYTSGSTSEPKGVIVTHANLTANLQVCVDLLGHDRDTVNVSWCPLTHDMGLIMGALPSVVHGCTSVLMPPSAFIRRPLSWLRAIDRYRGTHGYSPNFGYDLCVDRSTPAERAGLDLSSMRVWVNGAETVRERTRNRFVDAFAVAGVRPDSHTPAYGLAESTVLVSAVTAGPGRVLWANAEALEQDRVVLGEEDDPETRPLCSVGTLAPSYEVRIVDPVTAAAVEADRIGEVWLRGPSVCGGYWRRAEETAAAFGACLDGDDGGPYLRTGDLGFLDDGQVVICGRLKDLIVVHGRNIHPQDVELTAELAHDAVRLGGSAAFAIEDKAGEALVVVAEVDGEPDAHAVSAAILSAVLRDFELRVADVLLVAPRQVPKTSSGKKQRSAARELWLEARDLPAAHPPAPALQGDPG